MSKVNEMKKYFGEWYFEDIVAHIDKFELGTKIKSETGDVYNLDQAEGEGKQRKFSRWNGTRLRFMTYENIGKKFEIIEEEPEIDIQQIEELEVENHGGIKVMTENGEMTISSDETNRINQLIKAVKQLDKKINNK